MRNSGWSRFILVTTLCLSLQNKVHANEYMFSMAATIVVAPAFAVWLFAGLVMKFIWRNDFTFVGPLSAVLLFLGATLLFLHYELVLVVWLFYLGLLTVYYLFPRTGVTARSQKINLFFHGSVLLLVVVSGVAAKAIYLRRVGGFSRWLNFLEEIAPSLSVLYGTLLLVTSIWFYFRVYRRQVGGCPKKS